MGYCFISGEKVVNRWKFKKCDGRKTLDGNGNRCAGGDPISDYKGEARANQCITYSPTYTTAVRELEQWLKDHPGEE